MGNDRSVVLVIVTVAIGILAVAPTMTAPHAAPAKPAAADTAPAADGPAGNAPVASLLREFWDLAEGTEWSALQARFRADSTVLIASVADPKASRMAMSFDQSIEALIAAASAAGFTLDRDTLPWRSGAAPASKREALGVVVVDAGGDTAAARQQTKSVTVAIAPPSPPADDADAAPALGALMFRHIGNRDRALLVLLVGETATSGVHGPSMRAALNLAYELRPATPAGADLITVIGPSFSGSAATMANSIHAWRNARGDQHTAIRLLGAGATSERLPSVLNIGDCDSERPQPGTTCFRALTWSSGDTQRELSVFLKAHGATNDNTALFYEAGTAYGATAERDGVLTPRYVPYPLHLSQARAARAQAGLLSTNETTLNSNARATLSLSFEDPVTGNDAPPVFSGVNTANAADLQLATMLATLRRDHVAFVGILGSDVRDKLFLARRIKHELPDVQLYTLLADVLYLHPASLRDLNGMWVASSYPLMPAWQDTASPRVPFASHGQQATYNALLAGLVDLERDSWHAAALAGQLVDYDWWSLPGHTGPSLWISAVGNGEFWPLARIPAAREAESRMAALPHPSRLDQFLWSPAAAVKTAAPPELTSDPDQLDRRPSRLIDASLGTFGLSHLLWALLLLVSLFLLFAPERWVVVGRFSDLRWLLRRTRVADVPALLAATWFAALVVPILYEVAIAHPGMARVLDILPSAVNATEGDASVFHAGAYHGGAFLVARTVHFDSGLSPVVPAMSLAGCVLLMVFCAARRRRLRLCLSSLAAVGEHSSIEPYVRRVGAALGDRASGASWLAVPVLPGAGAAAIAGVVLFGHWVDRLDPAWGWGMRGLFVLLFATLAAMSAAFLLTWQRLSALLRSISRTPLLHAFKRLPDEFAEALDFRLTTGPALLSDLRYSVDQLALLMGQKGHVEIDRVSAYATLARETFDAERRAADTVATPALACASATQEFLSSLAGRMLRALDAIWAHDLACGGAGAGKGAGDRDANDRRADVLRQHQTRTNCPNARQVALAEEFVAAELTRYFAYVFLHMKNLLVCATFGAILLLVSVMSYPFHPQQTAMRLVIGGMMALIVVFAIVVVQTERNVVLSKAASRTPDRVDLDSRFIGQLATFIGLPLLTLLVTEFPALDELVQRLRGY